MLKGQRSDGSIATAFHAHTGAEVSGNLSTGNICWAGLAFIQGWAMLGNIDYLNAAEMCADYVLSMTKNTVGHGGFTLSSGSSTVSTEHCVDASALFSRLALELPGGGQLLSQTDLQTAARHARIFVESRFDPILGLTYTGTDATGVATNPHPIPEDTQVWTLLALGREKWLRGYDWTLQPAPDGLWTASSSCPSLGPSTRRSRAMVIRIRPFVARSKHDGQGVIDRSEEASVRGLPADKTRGQRPDPRRSV